MNKVTYNLRKAAPYICFGTGIVTFGCTITAAIRATMRLSDILEEYNSKKAEIEEVHNDNIESLTEEDTEETRTMLEKSYKSDKRSLTLHTVGRIALNYSATGAFGAACLASFGGAFGFMREDYLGVSAALCGVTEAFDRYRNNVKEDLGADADAKYMYGYSLEKEEIEDVNPETGKKKKTKRDIFVGSASGFNTRRWEKWDYEHRTGTTQWCESPAYSYDYITSITNQYQKKLDNGDYVIFADYLKELDLDTKGIDKESKAKRRYEHRAGWRPGDRILTGLEVDGDRSIPSREVIAFLTDMATDVTLCFNPRPDVFAVEAVVSDPITIGCDGDEVIFEEVPLEEVKEETNE